MTYEEIMKKQRDLRQEMLELDKKIIDIQRHCRHPELDKKQEIDDNVWYTDYTCKKCGYKWSESE